MIIGIDPDVKATAFAAVDREGKQLLSVGVFRTRGGEIASVIRQLSMALTGFAAELVVVESQRINAKRTKSPNDILKLGQVAGAVAMFFAQHGKIAMPEPSEWKGSTPKDINQARSFSKVGILYTKGAGYCYPSGCASLARVQGAAQLNQGDWKHVADALGLALHGAGLLRS